MTTRTDDPAIADDDRLWRRVAPTPALVVLEPDGSTRPSSAAFLDGHTGEVSVHRSSLTTIDAVTAEHPGVGVAEIIAGLPRSLGHALVPDPSDDHPSHALICPPAGLSNSRRKANARRMAGAATWVIPPPLLTP